MKQTSPNPSLWRRFRFDLAFFHWLKQFLPRTLYGRAFLILVTPVILAQAVATVVFYDRHWTTVANRLAFAVAGEIGVIVDEMERDGPQKAIKRLERPLAEIQNFTVMYEPGKSLSAYPMRGDYATIFASMLRKALDEKLQRPTALDLRYAREWIAVYVPVQGGVLTVIFPERRVYTPTTTIFIIWMLGSSLLLSIIAVLFLRNQIRPIKRLAKAAEAIGKGQDMPQFKPEGAIEVRQAAINLLIMRDRLKRQMTQRTAMLNGVSHDLRTPLTRMKLQLALMPASSEIDELKADVEEMSEMVESYLAFIRDNDMEDVAATDLDTLVGDVVAAMRRLHDAQGKTIHFRPGMPLLLLVRPQALRRAITNLVGNAARYGKEVWVAIEKAEKHVFIVIEDNGPGIPEAMREDVFRPFTRLEESRNQQTGGIGLGLTIARDIAQAHGGDIILGDSAHGGLKAALRLPL